MVTVIAVVVVAMASAAFGGGSMRRASGFTLYQYNYSVHFNTPATAFGIEFNSVVTISSVRTPSGFSSCSISNAELMFVCIGNVAAHTAIHGSFHLKKPLRRGAGAGLLYDGVALVGSITGP